MSNSRLFLYGCCAFIAGIGIASFVPTGWLGYELLLFALALGCLTASFFCRNRAACPAPGGVPCSYAVILSLFFFGVWRYSIVIPQDSPADISHYNGRTATFTGVIASEPDVRPYNQKLTVDVAGLAQTVDTVLPVRGKVLVTANLYPRYRWGDTLNITCLLKAPEAFNEFAYDRYLARYDIYSACYYPRQVARLETKASSNIAAMAMSRAYATMLAWKESLNNAVAAGLPEPEAALLQSILFNNRSNLPPELLETFSRTGVTHIIAISGSHLSFIAAVAVIVLLQIGLNRRQAVFLSLAVVAGYIVLVGAPASALRAGVMAGLAVMAFFAGRLHSPANILVLSVAILSAFNPRIVRDDIGFQLSVAAVVSIIYCYPVIEKWLTDRGVPTRFGLREAFSLTVGAQIFTAPIAIYNFHQLSLVAPVANILAFVAVMPIMILGMAGVLFSLAFSGVAWLFLAPAYGFLKYFIWLSDVLARAPLAFVNVEYLPGWWVAAGYLGLGGWIVFQQRGERKKENFKAQMPNYSK